MSALTDSIQKVRDSLSKLGKRGGSSDGGSEGSGGAGGKFDPKAVLAWVKTHPAIVACVGVMVIDEHDARTSMRFGCVVKIGIGCDMGSRPILIRFALSDSFSQARARSCSACTLVKCGGVGRH